MPSSRWTPRRRERLRAGSIPPLRIDFMFWANRGGCAVKTNGCRFPGGRRAGCPHPAAPRGGANARGRIWNPPLRPTEGPWSNGKPCANGIANLCRGRCSHRPGNPAAVRTPAGGINPAPTNNFYVWANRGGRAVKTNGGRFPGGRRAGCPHPAAPRGNINARGRAMALPYKPRRAANQPGNRKPSRRCKLL